MKLSLLNHPTAQELPEPELDSERGREIADKLRLLNLTETQSSNATATKRKLARPNGTISSRTLLFGTIIVAQAAALGWLAYGRQGRELASSKVPVAAVNRPLSRASGGTASDSGQVDFEAQGFTVATRRATVSARVAGIVTAVNIDVGDRVVQGQVLGRLDAANAIRDLELAQQRFQTLKAQVRMGRAQLIRSDGSRLRTQALFDRGFSTRADLERVSADQGVARAQLDSQQSELASAGIQIKQLREVVDNYTIRAPFAGIVIEKNAQQGELLAPTGAGGGFTRTGFATIIDMNSLEIVVDVGEQFVARVGTGQPVNIGFYAIPGLTIPGHVSQIMPSADRAKGTVQVRIKLESSDPRILPDMGTKVMFKKCRDRECQN